MGNRFDGYVTVTTTGANATSGGVSAQLAIPNCSSGEKPRFIRVASTASASVRLGKTTATATTADTQVQPGDAITLQVPVGYDVIAIIQVSAPGTVQVSALENM